MYLPPRFVEALRLWEILENSKYPCILDWIFTLYTYKLTSNVIIVFSFLHLCTYQPCIYHSNKWNIYDPFDVSLYVQSSYIIHVCTKYRKNTYYLKRHKAWKFKHFIHNCTRNKGGKNLPCASLSRFNNFVQFRQSRHSPFYHFCLCKKNVIWIFSGSVTVRTPL